MTKKGARLRPRPEINAGNQDLADITSRVWAAIKKENDPPSHFRFGGTLCRLEFDEEGLRDGQSEEGCSIVDKDLQVIVAELVVGRAEYHHRSHRTWRREILERSLYENTDL